LFPLLCFGIAFNPACAVSFIQPRVRLTYCKTYRINNNEKKIKKHVDNGKNHL
jgi:hypothetical protein